MILGAVFLMVFMIKKNPTSESEKIEYTVFWIIFSGILVLRGIFPQLFYWVSELLWLQAPINMIYLVIIFVLDCKAFSYFCTDISVGE